MISYACEEFGTPENYGTLITDYAKEIRIKDNLLHETTNALQLLSTLQSEQLKMDFEDILFKDLCRQQILPKPDDEFIHYLHKDTKMMYSWNQSDKKWIHDTTDKMNLFWDIIAVVDLDKREARKFESEPASEH